MDSANPIAHLEIRLYKDLSKKLSTKICQSLTFMLRMIGPFLPIFLPTKKVLKRSFYKSYGAYLFVDKWAVYIPWSKGSSTLVYVTLTLPAIDRHGKSIQKVRGV